MPFFKYVIAERLDILENELIRFTHPTALNDPWDMRPHVERLITDTDLEQITTPLTQQSDEELINWFSEILENISRTYNLADKSLEEIKLNVIEANKEFPGVLRQLCEGAFAESLAIIKQNLPSAVEYVPEALDKAVGVLSLTEKPDHPLMWSHYADNHSGFVIEFDETHNFFRSPRRGEPDDMGSVRIVKYCTERPKLDPMFDMSWVDNLPTENVNSWIDKMFFTKSEAWSYEKEWRMIKPLKEATKAIETPTDNVHLFQVPASCIVSVILGERMPAKTRERVIEFITSAKRHNHVKMFTARSSTKNFTIEFSPL